ncbi:MAG: DUF4097 domain-containing protein [Clostridiales bacterium]|nr:DUF4097 domain-containing protein [Clostridiales bacterium]
MRKGTIVSLIVLVIGFAMAGVGFANGGMQPLGLHLGDGSNGSGFVLVQNNNQMERVDQTWRNDGTIKNLQVNLNAVNRIEIRAEGDSFSVKGQNWRAAGGLTAELTGDTLTVGSEPSRNLNLWWFGFGPSLRLEDCGVVITVPQNVTLDTADAKSAIGGLYVTGIKARELSLNNDTGNTTGKNIDADNFKMTSSIGGCKLDSVRTQTANISLNTGEFTANDFLSLKELTFKTSLGNAAFTNAVLNGNSRFETSTGNLTLSLRMPRGSVGYEIESSTGEVRIDGTKVKGKVTNIPPNAAGHLSVESSLGNVTIDFTS